MKRKMVKIVVGFSIIIGFMISYWAGYEKGRRYKNYAIILYDTSETENINLNNIKIIDIRRGGQNEKNNK